MNGDGKVRLHYGYTMVSEKLAICPVFLPQGGEIVGIEGDDLCVSLDGGSRETRVGLPFFDGGPCSVETFMVPTDKGDEPLHMLIPDQRGSKQMKVKLEQVRGQWFAVCGVEKRPYG